MGAYVQAYGNISSTDAYTDANGVYTFNHGRMGCCITIEARVPGSASYQRQYASATLSADSEVITRNFVFPARVTLRVRVQNAEGGPLANIQVYVNDVWRGTTGQDGMLDVIHTDGRQLHDSRAG